MQHINDYVNRLKYLLTQRATWYCGTFPGNSCYIYGDGTFSADCIGMIKGVINTPDIVQCFTPGTYAKIGAIIGDIGERQIFNECSGQSSDFRNVPFGAYLEMDSIVGHAGVYVGEFDYNGYTFNTIECTTDFGGGVVASYVNQYGQRMTCKGGYYSGLSWERFGLMTKWLDYSAGKLEVDGVCGPATIKRYQEIAKKDYPEIIIDGIFSGQNEILLNAYFPSWYKPAFELDGVGSVSVKVLQRICRKFYAGKITGIWDYQTAEALQLFLADKGFKTSDDFGVFDQESCKAWQRFLNTL